MGFATAKLPVLLSLITPPITILFWAANHTTTHGNRTSLSMLLTSMIARFRSRFNHFYLIQNAQNFWQDGFIFYSMHSTF